MSADAPHGRPDGVRGILVRGPNWLGDLIMSTPGFRALRAGFPGARITLQVSQAHADLFAGEGFFDRVLALGPERRGLRAIAREAAVLRRSGSYDLGLCIPDSHSSALIMRLGGVRNVVGYAGRARGPLLHRSVPVPDAWGRRRMVAREDFVLGLCEAVGCPSLGGELELVCSPGDEVRVDELLFRHAGERGDAPLVGLAPGASYGAAKRWPLESFAALGDSLSRAGARVVLLGSPDELRLTAELRQRMKEGAIDLAGELALGPLKAMIRRLDLLVCNDAGARHIAVAFGVPSIVFFGPTSVAKTDANLDTVEVIEAHGVDCRPCYRRECPIDHRCMRRLEPAAVAERALRMLATGLHVAAEARS